MAAIWKYFMEVINLSVYIFSTFRRFYVSGEEIVEKDARMSLLCLLESTLYVDCTHIITYPLQPFLFHWTIISIRYIQQCEVFCVEYLVKEKRCSL